MNAIRIVILLILISAPQSLRAIELGTYVVSFGDSDGHVYPGLLVSIEAGSEGLEVQVIQEGFKCDAKIGIGRMSEGVGSSEKMDLSIVLIPKEKGSPGRMFLLSGTCFQKQGENLEFDLFKGNAMISEEGKGTPVTFVMTRVLSQPHKK